MCSWGQKTEGRGQGDRTGQKTREEVRRNGYSEIGQGRGLGTEDVGVDTRDGETGEWERRFRGRKEKGVGTALRDRSQALRNGTPESRTGFEGRQEGGAENESGRGVRTRGPQSGDGLGRRSEGREVPTGGEAASWAAGAAWGGEGWGMGRPQRD